MGISGIALQNTDGLNKTYRVTFTNSSTFDFTVIDGATGSQGIKGDKGEKGDTGSAGSQGIQGIQGPAGANGSDASVTKENVENVLTGNINSHSHYDSIVYSIIL